jgi:fibronectin-binding autotransporter adhesin
VGVVASIPHAHAATATWLGTTDSNWATNTDWSPATAPGSTSSTTSTDTAIFNNSGNGHTSIAIDPNRNIDNIIFDTSTAAAYSFNGGPLLGTSGGEILINSSVTQSQTFNNPFIAQGSGKTAFTFINNAASSAATFNFQGNISSASGTALVLGGTNTGTNTLGGAVTTSVVIIDESPGTWVFSGSNSAGVSDYLLTGTVLLSGTMSGNGSLNAQGAAVQLTSTYSKSILRADFGSRATVSGNGQFGASSPEALNGGSITIDNSANPINNRLNGNTLVLGGGSLNYVSSNGANSEQTAFLYLTEGANVVNLQSNPGGSTTLTAASINRNLNSIQANGTLLIVGQKLGSPVGAGVSNLLVTSAGAGTTPIGGGGPDGSTNISIQNYAVIQDTSLSGNAQYGLVTGVGSANGLRALSTAEYTTSISDGADSAITLNNANLTSAWAVNGVSTTVNALRLDTGGAIGGAGTLTVNSGAILALPGNTGINVAKLNFGSQEAIFHAYGNLAISGNIAGSGGLTKTGPGTLTLPSMTLLSYSGKTVVNQGLLTFGVANQIPGGLPFELSGGSADLNGFNQSVQLLSGNANGSQSAIVNSKSSTTATLTITGGTSSTKYLGTIGAPGENNIALNIDIGASSFGISQACDYSGPTTLTSGVTDLDFSQPNSPSANILPATTHLNNAALLFLYQATSPASQTFNGVTQLPGIGQIIEEPAPVPGLPQFLNAASIQVDLGLLTRTVGGTAHLFPGTVGSGFITSDSNTNGIIGGWATINRQDWAVANGAGDISSYTAYVNDTWSPGANVTVTTNSTQTSATANSLRFGAASTNTVTLSGTCLLSSGGILVAGTVGANLDKIVGGTLEGAPGADLVVSIGDSNANGGLEIDSVIANNGSATALTVSANDSLILTGNNSYTGPTYLDLGTLKISANSNLGSGSAAAPLYLEDGTLAVTQSVVLDNGGINPRPVIINGFQPGISIPAGNTFTIDGVISGSSTATLSVSSTGTLDISNPNNTFAGTVLGGSILIANAIAAQDMTAQNNTALNFAPNISHFYLGGLAGSSSVSLTDQAQQPITLTIGGNNQNTTYTGSLTLGAGFIKVGSGTTTISGFVLGVPNFTINAGAIQFTGQSAMTNASILNNSLLEFTAGATGVGYVITGNGTMNVAAPVQIEMTTVNQNAVINNGYLRLDHGGAFGPLSGTGTLGIGVGTISGTVAIGASTGLSTVGALSIYNSSVLDIQNNRLLIHYGTTADPISTVSAMLTSGYANGSWNGPGINSSTAAANSTSYGLGYADSADTGNPAALPSGNIEIAYTLLGDTNLDLTVNGVDFGILAANFNHAVSRWDQGDFNYDNVVNGVDFGELAANFNKGATGASGPSALSDPALVAFAQANGLMADVPEPAVGALTALAVIGALTPRCRSRRNYPN